MISERSDHPFGVPGFLSLSRADGSVLSDIVEKL
jgi:hypothetical protein